MRPSHPLVAAAAWWMASAVPSLAQSSPNLTYQQVPTAGQWNSYFAGKQDLLRFPPFNKNGDTMLGRLLTAPSTPAGSGFSLPPGVTPTVPNNGDVWSTPSSIFVRLNGQTFDLLHPSLANLSGQLTPSQLPAAITITPSESADGVRNFFDLPVKVDVAHSAVAINGLYQQLGSYTLTATSLQFSMPPPAGSMPIVVENALPTTAPSSGSGGGGATGAPQIFPFTGDGATTNFNLPSTPQTLDRYTVAISGVYQARSSCSLNAAALVCVAPPPAGTDIEVQDGP